jgi:alpha-L-arabinofuranosidase
MRNRLIPFPDNNRHLFQTVGPRCCAAIIPGGAAAPPYPLHRLSLGIGIIPAFAILTILLTTVSTSFAQANLPIYTDNLVNGFQDWSWATRNLSNTSPTHSGADSISVTSVAWTALSFQHSDFNVTPYASLAFWAHGGTSGGQRLQVNLSYGPNGATNGPAYALSPALPAGAWQQYSIPLSSLKATGVSNYNRVTIQLTASGTTNTFYMDDIQLVAAPAPALVHLTVDANQTIRTADARWFGLNTAVWDSYFDTTATSNALQELGCLSLRFPGGSLSDNYYDWVTGKDGTNNRPTKWPNFMHIATNAGVQAFITVNYGTGTSNKAADWVKSANITNHCNFKYWEVGNECYGSWETDTNTVAHDPYTYATRAAGYIALMKAADPTIKVGVVAVPGENSSSNNAAHPTVNPRTGVTHYGWTPVMLARLKSLGAIPDFLIYHVYPQSTSSHPTTGTDSDALVLQSTAGWASDAADLRQQLTDYLGTAGASVELVCTENNSDSGALGRQLTSIVNGLYLADSMSQLMKTEFNAYTWWDLRNGQGNDGSFDSTLYGWRTYGDEGIINANGNPGVDRYPVFYGFKMMQYYVRPGDTILNAGSDYLLLSAYAARKANGALALLVINKDATTNFNAQISLSNFVPASTATARAYGIAQDEAVRTNNLAPGAQDIATNIVPAGAIFTNSFPPYSLTLFTFAPAPAQLSALVPQTGQFVLQLHGQPGTPYIIQRSPDLSAWIPVSTNTQIGNVLNITNLISAGVTQQFWRAVWQP